MSHAMWSRGLKTPKFCSVVVDKSVYDTIPYYSHVCSFLREFLLSLYLGWDRVDVGG